MLLPITPITSSRFTYNKASDCLVAEASDVGGLRLHQLYDDACDIGIAIQSERTGYLARFYLDREEKSAEGEVVAWHFLPLLSLRQAKSLVLFRSITTEPKNRRSARKLVSTNLGVK